jgi:hypothetical protein
MRPLASSDVARGVIPVDLLARLPDLLEDVDGPTLLDNLLYLKAHSLGWNGSLGRGRRVANA